MKFFLVSLLFISYLFADDMYKKGKQLYQKTCISCHGVDGNADVTIQLIVRPRSLKKSILTEQQSYEIIKHGAHYWGANADVMPPFESLYTEYELKSLAFYIKKEFNPNIKEKIDKLYSASNPIQKEKHTQMMQRGKKVFQRNCSWCHGHDARGNGETTKNPKQAIYPYNLRKTLLTDKQMFLYAKYGGKYWGTYKDDMPSWKRKYDDFTLKSVIFYIEETFRKENNKISL